MFSLGRRKPAPVPPPPEPVSELIRVRGNNLAALGLIDRVLSERPGRITADDLLEVRLKLTRGGSTLLRPGAPAVVPGRTP